MNQPTGFQFEIPESDRQQLASVLRCPADDLDANLLPYFAAAQEEYLQMFLGRRVFTRGSDLREYRLLLLIKTAWKRIPSEAEVSALFQTTATQSRSLLRAVLSKYQYELELIVAESLRGIIVNASMQGDSKEYILTSSSANTVESLNLLISSIDSQLVPVSRKADTVSAYVLPASSRRALLEYWGVDEANV